MLGIYNQNLNNNMFINQNYGYGAPVTNSYQQPASIFGGFGGYQQQQQQPAFDFSSLIGLLFSSILGQGFNQQSASPFSAAFPGVNIDNASTGKSVNTGLGSFSLKPSQVPSQTGIWDQLLSILGEDVKSSKPLDVYQEDVEVTTKATGDPHFAVGDKYTFDFQGKNNGQYKMLENNDVSLNAKFADSGNDARIIHDQNLQFKDSGINVVSHSGGTFEILKNGQKIGDQTNYNKDQKVIDALKQSDIKLNFDNNVLKTTHGKRTLEQTLKAGNIDNTGDTLMKGDKGLLTQAVGAADSDHDGQATGLIDVNKDGKVDDKDILKYDAKNQFMVDGKGVAAAITPEIEAAIKKDITEGLKQGSVVKGFSASHGYSAMQWNEYVGGKLYSIDNDKYLAA
jgi:hypothetical protein